MERFNSPEMRRFIKFCVVAGSGVFVNMGILWLGVAILFTDLENAVAISGAVSIGVSILTNFLLNDLWTWADRPKRGIAHFFSRMTKYVFVASIAGVVQWGVLV